MLQDNGTLEFINAGHPSPLLLRGGKVEDPFPAACCPVGLIPDIDFSSTTVTLAPGDTLVLFSDGVSEAMDPEQKEFGIARLKEAAGALASAPLNELQDGILESVRQFARGARQADDVTLLILRYSGAKAAEQPTAA
jgi:sigma-B regulation protein RsbU (phosphoserine phosphatase)